MFPTGVGMNRVSGSTDSRHLYVPHGCGDEPEKIMRPDKIGCMFPTGVGMNPVSLLDARSMFHVPHGCGDEPEEHWSSSLAE